MDDVEVRHVPFGLVLGPDGKRLRTRSGDNVRLIDLLTEAVERAKAFLVARAEEHTGGVRGAAPQPVNEGEFAGWKLGHGGSAPTGRTPARASR